MDSSRDALSVFGSRTFDLAFVDLRLGTELGLQLYAEQTLVKAKEPLEIVGNSYKKGAASLLDLLDARRTYNQTRVAANQAAFDYNVSVFQLEQATGQKLAGQK
ncbi:MAG TPA: TolC family protein [Planctomycetota bacterium]